MWHDKQEYKDIYDVVGAAQEVHSTLGRGMHERIYQEALAVEMKQRGMDYEREKHLHLTYKGVDLDMTYIADFYYKDIIIVLTQENYKQYIDDELSQK